MNLIRETDRPKDVAGAMSSAQENGTQRFVFISEILGRPVVNAGGRRLGKLADLKVHLAESFPKMSALVVRLGRKKTLALDWSEVASFMGDEIVLKPGGEERFCPLD